MPAETVLFLTYWYPTSNNQSFAIFVKRHAHAIALQNKVIVLSLHFSKGAGIFSKNVNVSRDEANIETHQIDVKSRFNKILFLLLPLHYLLLKSYIKSQLIPANNISIIHSNIIFPCAIVARRLAKNLKCRFVITEHWTKLDKFFRVSLYSNSGKRTYDKADAITVVSEQLADTVKKYSSSHKIHIVPNIIDTSEFYFDETILKNKQLTFVAAAHWGQFKNPFYFLEALRQLKNENKLNDFKMVMIGDGEQIPKIKDSAYNFEIEYKGQLNAKQLCREFNTSHIFLHGSDFETFSVVIAEALMCGLPSVVSPVGIALEVINHTNGEIAENNITSWKEKIMLCCNKKYDNKLISQQLKGRYDSKAVGELFTSIYKNL
ncbi:MAG: glycosyltransferase family 4 protein [Bacteroidia bacterium]|nr:glycosyltransferase family 4 protein [Bacteroidia bacterium]